MIKDRKALKLALEALEWFEVNALSFYELELTKSAIDAIKEALAQPEQEPVTDEENEAFSRDVSKFKGTDEAATMYALEKFLRNRRAEQKQTDVRESRVTETGKPEQEPVADRLVRQYINSLVANKPDEAANATKAMVDYVYTSLPKRSWVDLTEQEALDCFSPNPVTHRKNIAVKIKEKNT